MIYQCSLCNSHGDVNLVLHNNSFVKLCMEKAQVYMKHSEITQSRGDVLNTNGSSEFFNNQDNE